jgi:hypothetical protein
MFPFTWRGGRGGDDPGRPEPALALKPIPIYTSSQSVRPPMPVPPIPPSESTLYSVLWLGVHCGSVFELGEESVVQVDDSRRR